jgi:hypothetical protein
MFFANPWGLLGLLALPVIVVLHLFHRRFPPRLVGGLHLWGVEQQVPVEGRRRETLPVTPSLLLELLAAVLLTLLLSQPKFADTEGVEHFVVVLDNSASMSAVDRDGRSARDRALSELRQRVEASSESARLTLIATGRRPAMIAGPAVEWSAASEDLESWQPELPDHSPQPAIDLAVQIAEDGGRILFLTDRLPEESSDTTRQAIGDSDSIEVIASGLPLANLAITSAHWSLDPQTLRGTIFLRVANLGPRSQTASVRGVVDGHPVFESQVELEPGAESALQTEVPGGAGQLTVSLAGRDDALGVDSSVTLIEPRLRAVRVDVRFAEDDRRRRDVLRVLEQIPAVSLGKAESELVIASLDELSELSGGQWGLGIGQGLDVSSTAEAEPSRTNDPKAIEPTADAGGAKPVGAAKGLVAVSGPYLIDRRHPLLESVELDGVVWGGIQTVDDQYLPLISCGALPLLVQLTGLRTTTYALNIDLRRSNLTESPDWPILLSNLISLRQQSLPGLGRWNFRVNEDVRFRVPSVLSEATTPAGLSAESFSEPVEMTLTHGETSRTISTLGLIELPAVENTGVYSLTSGSQLIERFSVNFFDRAESDLMSCQSGVWAPRMGESPGLLEIAASTHWLILAALLLLMALVLVDWTVLRRRPAVDGLQ